MKIRLTLHVIRAHHDRIHFVNLKPKQYSRGHVHVQKATWTQCTHCCTSSSDAVSLIQTLQLRWLFSATQFPMWAEEAELEHTHTQTHNLSSRVTLSIQSKSISNFGDLLDIFIDQPIHHISIAYRCVYIEWTPHLDSEYMVFATLTIQLFDFYFFFLY